MPYDSNNRRFRRSLAGRRLPRRRPPPAVIRGAAPPPPSRVGRFITGALLLVALLAALLLLGGLGAAYTAYAQLADSLKGRLGTLTKHDTFQTTRIFDRHGVLLYEFFGAGKECEGCEQEFFPAGHVKSNFLCNLGYGDREKLLPRSPRLEFKEACTLM